jgi:hypothetical protein
LCDGTQERNGGEAGDRETSVLDCLLEENEDHAVYCFTCSLGTPVLSDWVMPATWGSDKGGDLELSPMRYLYEKPKETALWLEHKPD